MIAESVLSSKGQLTVPQEIRAALALEIGDRVEFILSADGTVQFRAINLPLEALFALHPAAGPAKTIDQIEQGIAAGATEFETRRAKNSKTPVRPSDARSEAA